MLLLYLVLENIEGIIAVNFTTRITFIVRSYSFIVVQHSIVEETDKTYCYGSLRVFLC